MTDQETVESKTTGSSIRRSSRASSNRKPKKNQIPFGVILIVAYCIYGIYLISSTPKLGFFWFSGLAFGFILQRARFCFTASMRDPYLTGGTSLTRAVLIAFAITTIGFTAIKYGALSNGLPIPGMGYVVPVSLATVIGAIMFGTGMVIAGGCASGTLMRVGEGFYMNLISMFFFIIGSLWGAHDFGWWKLNIISKGKSFFLPDYFGWAGALVLQLGIILALYVIAVLHEQKSGASH